METCVKIDGVEYQIPQEMVEAIKKYANNYIHPPADLGLVYENNKICVCTKNSFGKPFKYITINDNGNYFVNNTFDVKFINPIEYRYQLIDRAEAVKYNGFVFCSDVDLVNHNFRMSDVERYRKIRSMTQNDAIFCQKDGSVICYGRRDWNYYYKIVKI